jgi:uncharacterized protein with HEPN domain/predicted RNase H-like HicB family nuclease
MSFEPRDYLRHILVEADYLIGQSAGLSVVEFLANETLRRAFVRSLEIVGEAAKKVPDEFRARYPAVDNCRVEGFWRVITFKVEVEQEEDGRWLAEVLELPGVLAYGQSQDAAVSKVQALALRVVAERLEHGEAGPQLLSISFAAA